MNDWGYYNDWSGDCAKFASLAWGGPSNTPGGNAIDMYYAYLHAGMVDSTHRPPRGALVFFNIAQPYGHVAVSIGNWQMISTQGLDNARLPIAGPYNILNYAPGHYLGWAMPANPPANGMYDNSGW